MAPWRASTTKSEWLPDDPTGFLPTRLWKLPFITTWDDSRNQNHPTDSAEEAEVGGVVRQRARLQLFDADDLAHNRLLDVAQQCHRQGMHLVPEMLTIQILGREAHQLGQGGGLSPSSEGAFAAWRTSPADHACQ